MPEMLEIEVYRRAADDVVGRRIVRVLAPDAWYLKGGLTARTARSALRGRVVEGTRRRGKLLLLDLAGGHGDVVLGLRFGMTGRLLVDGGAPIDRLRYGSDRAEAAWDRFSVGFEGGGSLVIRDPRRLGGVELDPDEDRLGPDALVITRRALALALGASLSPVKALLMDQSRVAGLGNLLVDEALWRAGVAPDRRSASLHDEEVAAVHAAIRSTLRSLGRRGGSHTGDLMPARLRGGLCPRDGTPLRRDVVGGRTTFWCPEHQR